MKKKKSISIEEEERISKYIEKIKRQEVFTIEEHDDFKNLCRKMSEEMPREKREDFDWAVADLLGFIEGAMTVSAISRLIDQRISEKSGYKYCYKH